MSRNLLRVATELTDRGNVLNVIGVYIRGDCEPLRNLPYADLKHL
jgi:hypothetical protein